MCNHADLRGGVAFAFGFLTITESPTVDPARDAELMTLTGEAPLIDDRGRNLGSVDPTPLFYWS
jgi:hypothetical protein